MAPRALAGALGGGLLGAFIWAAITALTGFEVGYVAWGVGFLVGGGAAWLGGSGNTSGVICASLAIASIFVGKMMAIQFGAPAEIRRQITPELTQERFAEFKLAAEDFSKLTSEEQYPAFILEHGYTEASSVETISEEDISAFNSFHIPAFKDYLAERPDYETWKEHMADFTVNEIMAKLPLAQLVKEDLGAMDLLFAVLGIMTAFKLGRGAVAA